MTLDSTTLPGIDAVYDMGSPTRRFDSMYAQYYYGNGRFLTGISGGGNANTGNWGFDGNSMYNLNGGAITNGDLSHGATASLSIPDNGSSNSISVLNYYGNISLTVGTGPGNTSTWIFDSSGNLRLPTNSSSINYANGQPYGGGAGSGNTFSSITMTNSPPGASNVIQYGLGNLVVWNDGGWTIGEWNGTQYGTEGIRINPGIEGSADIVLPSDANAATQPIQVTNYAGNVRLGTGTGVNYYYWNMDKIGRAHV